MISSTHVGYVADTLEALMGEAPGGRDEAASIARRLLDGSPGLRRVTLIYEFGLIGTLEFTGLIRTAVSAILQAPEATAEEEEASGKGAPA